MNLLDSELVVASLRKAGYELVERAGQGRHDLVQYVQRPPACRGQDLQRPGPAETRQTRQSGQDHRRAGLHGPERSKADLRAGPLRRSGGRARSAASDSRLARTRCGRRRPAARSQPGAHGGQPVGNRRQLRKLRSAARSRDAADALPGLRADHDRLRQILHLLHRADGSRARAKPAARAHSGRGPAAGRRGLPRDHPAGPNGQQLQVSHRRPHHPTVRSAGRAARHRRDRPA